jgi:hypothetical protein
MANLISAPRTLKRNANALGRAKQYGIVWSNYFNAGGRDKSKTAYFIMTGGGTNISDWVLVFTILHKFNTLNYFEKVRIDPHSWGSMYVLEYAQPLGPEQGARLNKLDLDHKRMIVKGMFSASPPKNNFYPTGI